MYKAMYLSPMIPTYNHEVTGNFFSELLDFTLIFRSETYAIYEKNNLTIHLLRAGSDIGQMEFYLEVDDVDLVWSQIKDHITHLRHKPPFNQDYGMREIHIDVPETNTLLFIGQAIDVNNHTESIN